MRQPLTKKQQEVLDYLTEFIQRHDYSPSLQEIKQHFGLSSFATVHTHLTQLLEKGHIKRDHNRKRSIKLMPKNASEHAIEIPLLGRIATGEPIEKMVSPTTITPTKSLDCSDTTYALQVRGQSMADEQIRDGDIVIVEDRKTAEDGETVIALLDGSRTTLKTLYHEDGKIRLQPTDPEMQPLVVDAERVQIQGVVTGLVRKY